MAIFSKGLVLEQHKEPALSRNLVRFTSPQADYIPLERVCDTPPEELSDEQIIDIAREAQIVDDRDGRLLYRKLLRARGKAVAVIADAVDDEPFVSSQIGPLLKLPGAVCGGLALAERVACSGNVFIMVYKNITDLETRIPRTLEGYRVVRLRGGYPAEPSVNRLGMHKGGRKLIIGTGALIHLYRAVTENRKQSTVFLTVAGNCIANPMNLEVSLGMTLTQVLERCGLLQTPTRVVNGGPMTGIAILDTDKTLVTHTTRAVLAFRENRRDTYYSCIGCGRCERVCPVGLNPMYIYRFVQNSYFAHLRPFDAHLCTSCGTCSYICPSKLNISGTISRARQYAIDHFITPAAEEEEDDDLES